MSYDDVLNRLLKVIESTVKLPSSSIDVDADFADLGINSLIVMELLESIQEEFEVTLTPALFTDVANVSELAVLLERCQKDSVPGSVPETPAPSGGSADVLGYISRKYAVDLSDRGLGSIDEMVDALVADHSEHLMRHYGIASEQGSCASRPLDVAIVGISCKLPDAPDARAFWQNLLDEKNSVREVPPSRWKWQDHLSDSPRPGKTVSKWAALIDHVDCFDAGFFNIPAHEAAAMDPQQRLVLQEAYRALEDAGIDVRRLAGSNTGVFMGCQYSEYEQYLRRLNNQDMQQGPVFSSSSPSYYLANRISFTFDFRGPSESINVNCASSAVAINRAYYSLIDGESDVALAGGVSLNLFEGDYIASSQYGLLSSDGTSGVFDEHASGFTRGEGVAVIVLKRLQDAERDHDRIYAVIKSCHQSYRGAARSFSELKHESVTDVMRGCYANGSIDPESVRYIEVDGFARKWADSLEYEGIKNALQGGARPGKRCALGTVKGNLGNVEAASGVTHVIKLALAMHHKVFPASISKGKLNTFIDIDSAEHPLYIADKSISFADIREGDTPIRAGVNSFADSGTNVHILLEEYSAGAGAETAESASNQLFVLSARSPERLEAYVEEYIEALTKTADRESFSSVIYTAQTGREPLEERLAVVAASSGELIEKLSLFRTVGVRGSRSVQSSGIYRGSASATEKNPLAELITPEMASAQLAQSAASGEWRSVALLWVHGVRLPWKLLWQDKLVRPVSLPGYPFAADRYWIDVETRGADSVTTAAPSQKLQRASQPPAFKSDPGTAAASEPPASIERFLQQQVAELLHTGHESIALDKDLLDLGMSSIGIGELIRRTDKLLGCQLSPAVVFRYPQIGALADYLGRTFPERIAALAVSNGARAAPLERMPPSILVPVQTQGGTPPIFALPGAGGDALSLHQLSHALGNDQPLYCLQPVGLDGQSAPMSNVEEIAEFNIEAMRFMQPKGPYRLLGYSNGGVIAFEMARRLLKHRAKVSALTLVDCLCPMARGEQPIEDMVVAVFNHFARSFGIASDLDITTLAQVPESERSEFLYDFLTKLEVEVPRQQFMASFDVAIASEHACRAYRPSRLTPKIDVALIKASRGYPGAPDDYGWQRFLAAPLRIFEVTADHFSIMAKGPVAEVASRIAAPPSSSRRVTNGAELAVSV